MGRDEKGNPGDKHPAQSEKPGPPAPASHAHMNADTPPPAAPAGMPRNLTDPVLPDGPSPSQAPPSPPARDERDPEALERARDYMREHRGWSRGRGRGGPSL